MRALYDLPAPAKLNLDLVVVGRRDDGYHLLDTRMVPIDWRDTLHVERRDDGRLARHDLGPPLPADDLCLRAARALQQASASPLGADISIDKRVPQGAGLGGGSSDAATVLLALNRLWGLDWPLARLLPIGAALGADVPFFLGGTPARATGIGERLAPISHVPRTVAVVHPGAALETRAVFASPRLAALLAARAARSAWPDRGPAAAGAPARIAGFSESAPPGGSATDGNAASSEPGKPGAHGAHELADRADLRAVDEAGAYRDDGDGAGNDLQASASDLCPAVDEALALLRTAYGTSRMTGSGSAVYAFVAAGGAAALPPLPPGWSGRICRTLAAHPLAGWA